MGGRYGGWPSGLPSAAAAATPGDFRNLWLAVVLVLVVVSTSLFSHLPAAAWDESQ